MDRNPQAFIDDLPTGTGIYMMKDAKGRVIYVGKAKNLKARVRSYFREGADTRPGVVFLMKRVADIEMILTDTEKEALILENNLIKEHRPRYNIHLRDDKDYLCLRLTTKEKFPRLITLRRPDSSSEPTFGPYASAYDLRQTMELINEIFPLRRCKPGEFAKRTRPCLNHQIGKCLAPCSGLIGEKEYAAMVENIKRLLKGHTEELLSDLENRMNEASEAMEYEAAAMYRDQIAAVMNTIERQKIIKHGGVDRDVLGLAAKGDRTVAARMRFREGKLIESNSFDMKNPGRKDEEVAGELLRRLYGNAALIPAEILVTPEPEDRDALEEWLSEKRGARVYIRSPVRGEGRELVEMAEKNARENMEASIKREFDREKVLEELAARLGIGHMPDRIECVDISNIGGKQAVGSLVAFTAGLPDKQRYRRYRIKDVEGQDDYAMMLEVLRRRLKRGSEDDDLPDLILLDGGKGQLNVARLALEELYTDEKYSGRKQIALAAIAKEREGKKGDRVFVTGRKNHLPLSAPAMHLLGRIRDEAHRFAITYHRGLRKKETLNSLLLAIPGIGPGKRDILLKHFGSLRRVSLASPGELEGVQGISKKDALEIFGFFKSQAENGGENGPAD